MEISIGDLNEKEVPNNGNPFIAEEVNLWIKPEHRKAFIEQIENGKGIRLQIRKNKDRSAVTKKDGTVLEGLFKTGWLTWYVKDEEAPNMPF